MQTIKGDRVNFHLNQTCEALQYLGGHSAQLLRIYTLEDWLFQVAIQVDIEHLCDDEIVLSENQIDFCTDFRVK